MPLFTVTKKPNGSTNAESRHLALIESVAQVRVPTKNIEEVSSSWQRCASELLINPEARQVPMSQQRANSGSSASRLQGQSFHLTKRSIVCLRSFGRKGMSFGYATAKAS
jgi:hypothetical protein